MFEEIDHNMSNIYLIYNLCICNKSIKLGKKQASLECFQRVGCFTIHITFMHTAQAHLFQRLNWGFSAKLQFAWYFRLSN